MQPTYENFVNGFDGINPFQLSHLAEILMVRLEVILADRCLQEKQQFSQQDLKHAVTCTMQILQVEIAERHMKEAQYKLCRKRQDTYTPFITHCKKESGTCCA